MSASPSTVISDGFGSFGAVALVITSGFGIGAYVPPVVPTKQGGDDAPRGRSKKDNVGFNFERWKREKQKPDEALTKTIESAYKRIFMGIEPEEAKEVLAPVIKARARVVDVPKPVQIDWEAVARREEVARWIAQQEDDDEAAAMLLLT